jgi:hypothetical protein
MDDEASGHNRPTTKITEDGALHQVQFVLCLGHLFMGSSDWPVNVQLLSVRASGDFASPWSAPVPFKLPNQVGSRHSSQNSKCSRGGQQKNRISISS